MSGIFRSLECRDVSGIFRSLESPDVSGISRCLWDLQMSGVSRSLESPDLWDLQISGIFRCLESPDVWGPQMSGVPRCLERSSDSHRCEPTATHTQDVCDISSESPFCEADHHEKVPDRHDFPERSTEALELKKSAFFCARTHVTKNYFFPVLSHFLRRHEKLKSAVFNGDCIQSVPEGHQKCDFFFI